MELSIVGLILKLLAPFTKRCRERAAVSDQFEELRRSIRYVSITNEYPVELHKLRAFLVKSGLIEEQKFGEFFEKWLTNPVVAIGVSALNVYSNEEREQLVGGLNSLTVRRPWFCRSITHLFSNRFRR